MYEVRYSKNVIKFLQKQDKKVVKSIIDFFDTIKNDPFDFKSYDVKSMKGFDNFYRLRIQKYRVIFEIRDNELIIKVIKAGSRGDVYK